MPGWQITLVSVLVIFFTQTTHSDPSASHLAVEALPSEDGLILVEHQTHVGCSARLPKLGTTIDEAERLSHQLVIGAAELTTPIRAVRAPA